MRRILIDPHRQRNRQLACRRWVRTVPFSPPTKEKPSGTARRYSSGEEQDEPTRGTGAALSRNASSPV
jgi:hypothetical protein